jgi:acetyl esterase/lipase
LTEIAREFVGLPSPVLGRAGAGGHPCQGIYHRPAGTRPATAFIATHYNVDFSEHYLASYLAERGYGFLGWNTRFRGNEAHFLLDHALAEIGTGVRWLREQAGAERVVLLGNSGGGSLMAAYQSQATRPNVTPVTGMRPLSAIADLPQGDLFVALAAHAGRPEVLTNWLDPSVTDERDPLSADPALDPFNPDNGPPYSAGFQSRYRAAQRERNERITDWALSELDALSGTRARDKLFTLSRSWADLRMIDPTIEPSDRKPNWCYLGEPVKANYGVFGIGTVSTLRTWLSMWSLRTSQCIAAPHLARITLPSLVVHATADACVYDADARGLCDALAAADKKLEFVEADHYLQEPAGARDQVADLIAAWVAARSLTTRGIPEGKIPRGFAGTIRPSSLSVLVRLCCLHRADRPGLRRFTP